MQLDNVTTAVLLQWFAPRPRRSLQLLRARPPGVEFSRFQNGGSGPRRAGRARGRRDCALGAELLLCAKAYIAVIFGAVTTDGWGSDARLLAGGSGPPRRPHAPGDGARGCGGARRLARRMRPADGGGPRGVPAGVDPAKHALPKWSERPSDNRGPAKGRVLS